jgi:hypothetical protein
MAYLPKPLINQCKNLIILTCILFLKLSVNPLCAKQYSGTYTIGNSGNTDFKSPALALSAIAKDTVSGPILFEIEDGEYYGSFEQLTAIEGTSPTNTITFLGNVADSTKTIISGGFNHVIKLKNVKHLRFKYLSIVVKSQFRTAGKKILDFEDCLDIDFFHVHFENISLSSDVITPSLAHNVYLDYTDSCDFIQCNFNQQFISQNCYNIYYYYSNENKLQNCTLTGGSEAFRQVGSPTDTLTTNIIDSCDISGYGRYAIYNYGFTNLQVKNSFIHDGKGALDNGYYERSCRGTKLINNTFFVRGMGLEIISPNQYPANFIDTTWIVNNAISSDGITVYITGGDLFNIYHNSFRCNKFRESLVINNNKTNRRFRVLNNIFETYAASYIINVDLNRGAPLEWDHNNYYRHVNASYLGYFNRNRFSKISDLRSSTLGFSNSKNVNPAFDSLDLRTVAPDLNNEGKRITSRNVVLSTDIDNKQRPNKFENKVDIGPNDFYLYCSNTPTNIQNHLAIGQVKLANLKNKSGLETNGFKYYHSKTAKLRQGAKYKIQIDLLKVQSSVQRIVWIDWNHDGKFNDTNEVVVYSPSSNDSSYIDSFIVPKDKLNEPTRMRVAVTSTGQKPLACSNFNFGEIEEYNIIILKDTIAPIIILSGRTNDSTNVFTSYKEPGFKAIDNLDGDITNKVIFNNNVDTSRLGIYTIEYQVKDTDNNEYSTTRSVLIFDSLAPQLILMGNDTVYLQVFNQFIDSGVVAIDNYDSAVAVITTGNVDTTKLGTYRLTYCATDSFGNESKCIYRDVIVIDTIAPSIQLVGLPSQTINKLDFYIDSGYTVSDNYYDSNQIKVDTIGTFINSQQEGVYDLIYVATDPSNNQSKSTARVIKVTTTSVSELSSLKIKLYPNPTSNGQFYIDISESYGDPFKIRVYNLNGKLVYSNSLEKINGRINLNNLKNGDYLFVISNNYKYTTRIISVLK